ncbi:c-type cytochrome [Chlorobium sp. N1]|uniref:c-type cytochrome n=1 Tax=Chlorobium sp. N1 TaxID=2491138 RepID=UPI00103A28C4|nr:c-type cytochrome [Chlorobium sp. N1]TCD48574.1 cytochrome c5 family protein [Chlorobium sp. N1]
MRILRASAAFALAFSLSQSFPLAEPALAAEHDLARGESIYGSTCSTCHNSGIMGAPKPGDKAAWVDRIAGGFDLMVAHSLNGFNGMPARGGRSSLTDTDVADAVAFMVSKSR